MTPLSEEHGTAPVSDKRRSGRGFMMKAIAGLDKERKNLF